MLLVLNEAIDLPPPTSLRIRGGLRSLVSIGAFQLRFFLRHVVREELKLGVLRRYHRSTFLDFFTVGVRPASRLLGDGVGGDVANVLRLRIGGAAMSR